MAATTYQTRFIGAHVRTVPAKVCLKHKEMQKKEKKNKKKKKMSTVAPDSVIFQPSCAGLSVHFNIFAFPT